LYIDHILFQPLAAIMANKDFQHTVCLYCLHYNTIYSMLLKWKGSKAKELCTKTYADIYILQSSGPFHVFSMCSWKFLAIHGNYHGIPQQLYANCNSHPHAKI